MSEPIDLDALLGDAGEVTLGGVTHRVLPLDGTAYKLLLRMRRGKMTEEEALDGMYEVAHLCCPSIPDITKLALPQVTAITSMAGRHMQEVEAHPKSSRPLDGPQLSVSATEDVTPG